MMKKMMGLMRAIEGEVHQLRWWCWCWFWCWCKYYSWWWWWRWWDWWEVQVNYGEPSRGKCLYLLTVHLKMNISKSILFFRECIQLIYVITWSAEILTNRVEKFTMRICSICRLDNFCGQNDTDDTLKKLRSRSINGSLGWFVFSLDQLKC